MRNLNFEQLIPSIIQDAHTNIVLMMGYMNKEAYEKTLSTKKVTFYSRSKKRLWTKGETSGNFLQLKEIFIDCDGDTLLLKVIPTGPVCHKQTDTCWAEKNRFTYGFLTTLENIMDERIYRDSPSKKSYVSSLFSQGLNKIAQKVGEEAVEMIIEAKDTNNELFLNESADLLFHYLLLLKAKKFSLQDVIEVLEERNK